METRQDQQDQQRNETTKNVQLDETDENTEKPNQTKNNEGQCVKTINDQKSTYKINKTYPDLKDAMGSVKENQIPKYSDDPSNEGASQCDKTINDEKGTDTKKKKINPDLKDAKGSVKESDGPRNEGGSQSDKTINDEKGTDTKKNKIYPDLKDAKGSVKESDDRRNEGGNVHFNILIIFVVLIIGVIFYFMFSGNCNTKTYNNALNKWKSTSQVTNEMGWRTLNATLYNHLYRNKREGKAAVINLLGHPDNIRAFREGLKELLNKIGVKKELYLDRTNKIRKNGASIQEAIKEIVKYDPRDIRDITFKDTCNLDLILFIEDAGELPKESLVTLHGFTDAGNCLFPNVLIVLGISESRKLNLDTTETPYNLLLERQANKYYEEHFKDKFLSDHLPALLSRIVVNVIYVQ